NRPVFSKPMKPFCSAYSALTVMIFRRGPGRPPPSLPQEPGCAGEAGARSGTSAVASRAGGLGRGAGAADARALRVVLRVVDPDLVRGGQAHRHRAVVEQHGDGPGIGRDLADREPDARADAALPEEAQELAVGLRLLGDPVDDERLPGL